MRRFRILAALFCLSLLALLGVGLVEAAPFWQADPPAPPRLSETLPLRGETLRLDQPLTLYFNQAMDRASVEAALRLAPPTPFRLTWQDDATLSLAPESTWQRGVTLRLTLDESAQSAEGLPLAGGFQTEFSTAGLIRISDVTPRADSTGVDPNTPITVVFSRPVVPLVTSVERNTLPQPLRFDPPLPGTGEWLNTSIYIFRPRDGLRGGLKQSVTVEAGLTDVDGSILEEAFQWSFEAAPPTLVDVFPIPGTMALLEPTFTLTFSQPMDRVSTEAAFGLYEGLTSQNGQVVTGAKVAGTFEWADDNRSFSFKPSERLALNSPYSFGFAEGALSASGGPFLRGDPPYYDVYTLPSPAIIATYPNDGETQTDPYGGFEISFNTPMNPETLEDKVIIEPAPWREFESYYRDYSNSYALAFDTEPSTTYTIRILPGMEDIYGNRIERGLTVTYTTAAYNPEINLNTPSLVGLYSAYADQTRVFATHRNVSQLNLELYRLEGPMLFRALFDPYRQINTRALPRVREWSIPVQSQLNRRLYELLTLSASGGDGIDNITCLGAPPTRILVGDTIIVNFDEPRPLRLRSAPNLAGEILAEFEPGTTLTVIGGPFCADGFLWWNVRESVSGLEGWSAEGTTGNYFVSIVQRPESPPAPSDAPALEAGVYYLSLSSPETDSANYTPLTHVALVQHLNVMLKVSIDELFLWVTDLQTGEPVDGVALRIFNRAGAEIARTQSQNGGVARLEIPRLDNLYQNLAVIAESADGRFGLATSDMEQGISSWEFNLRTNYYPSAYSAYLYTDRPVYRPNQPVYFRGIVRQKDDLTYTPPDVDEVDVKILAPDGQTVYREILPLTPYGSFSGRFDLAQTASFGYYRVVVTEPKALPDNYGYVNEYSVGFNVGTYTPPEFSVFLTPDKTEVLQGETLNIQAEGRYFFGGVVSEARVLWSAYSQPYDFPYQGENFYSFQDFNYDGGPDEFYGTRGGFIAEGEGRTDAEGKFTLSLPADLADRAESQVFEVEVRLIDESEQLVLNSTEVVVHQSEVYVGVRPLQYVGRTGQASDMEAIVVDWDSRPVANQSLSYRVVQRVWSSVMEEDELGRTVWTYDVEEVEIPNATGELTTDAKGLARFSFIPPDGGTYKIYVSTTDAQGFNVTSSAFTWVTSRDYVAWRQQNSDRFDLITDKDSYKVGDTAEILIASPFQGDTWALVTLEREGVLVHETFKLTSNSEVYRLPIMGNYAPNVFVSVLLMKGVDEANPYAEFRLSMAQLNVETEQLLMNIELSPQIAEGQMVGPGDEVTYRVLTTDWQGQPVSAEVGVALTDLAVLSVGAADQAGTLLQAFYAQQGLGVRTSVPLTLSVDRATQTILDTVKGGGGGGEASGIFDIRREFVDTPYWNAALVTDAQGLATFTVTLPDNLTTWRLDARAIADVGGRMLVGQNTFDLISTKPLLVRPITPRFFVADDVAMVGMVVNNNTDSAQTVTFSMEGTGWALEDPTASLSQTQDIPAGGRARATWTIRLGTDATADFTFFAQNADGSFSDASKPTATQGQPLPVYRYEVPEIVGTGGLLSPEDTARSELIALPRRFDVRQGELSITLDRSLAGATLDGLTYLRNYPHQCTEQTVSRFLPNIITLTTLERLGVQDLGLRAQLEAEVNFALQRLYATQKPDGGWGWFPETQSDSLVTAYALLGLSQVLENNTAPLDMGVYGRARNYIDSELRNLDGRATPAQLSRFAFYVYALSQADGNFASAASRLYEERDRLSVDARAFLALALHAGNPKDERLNVLFGDFSATAILSANGAHWEESTRYPFNWTTDTRTTALVLLAMTRLQPDHALIPNIVRWLMVARQGDSWETTQETAWAVMALSAWMEASGELKPDYRFSLALNGAPTPLLDLAAAPDNVTQSETLVVQVKDLLADQANRLTFLRDGTAGNLYYTAYLRAYLPVPEVEALSQGLVVERRYYPVDETRNRDPKRPRPDPITEAIVGQEVEVVLSVIAPADLHFVTIEDPIPAGALALDPALATSGGVADDTAFSARGYRWWFFTRTEFRDEKVVLYADHLPAGSYEFRYFIRLGVEGTFNVIPPSGHEFYFPEVYGRGAGSTFTILPSREE